MNTVPMEFWYASTLILVAILIWIMQKYYASLTETLKDLKINMEKLTQMVAINTHRIGGHDKDIGELQQAAKKRRS